MADKQLYDKVSRSCSMKITKAYSTSFSLGIKALSKEIHDPIYAIYGFVRLADEIVDTFHDYSKEQLLNRFRKDTYRAIEEGISLNPVLNSFQWAVKKYKIDLELIETFLKSMKMDLHQINYTPDQFKKYIVGSAEVVGLMCLKVFCEGNDKIYTDLTPYAMRLGSAFQKINFLRDLHSDYLQLGRSYFPGIVVDSLSDDNKKQVEKNIYRDFEEGLKGIKLLPKSSRFGVYLAYVYFYTLFRKIQGTHARKVLTSRIRVSNPAKSWLLIRSLFLYHFKLI